MIGERTIRGSLMRSPCREQQGVLAVINHVSGTAYLPSRGPDGGGRPPMLKARPHFFPRRLGNPLTLRADCLHAQGDACLPPARRALGGGIRGASLLPGAAVIFQFGLTARQPASNRVGQGSKPLPCVGLLHAQSMEANDARYRRKDFTFEGKDHARRR